MKLRALFLTLLVGFSATSLPADSSDLIVNCDMTPEGRKLPAPTAEKPVYYILAMAGYRELGDKVAGEPPPPPPEQVKKLVVDALSAQHFRGVTKNSKTPPSLMLVVHWGSARPELIDSGEFNPEAGSPAAVRNQREMDALVGGKALHSMGVEEIGRGALIAAASENRYFAVVTAYDWAAIDQPAGKQKKVLLWRARMSIPSQRTSLNAVLPLLVKNGAPFFGRETMRPETITVDDVPQGKVEVGPLKTVEESAKPATGSKPAEAVK